MLSEESYCRRCLFANISGQGYSSVFILIELNLAVLSTKRQSCMLALSVQFRCCIIPVCKQKTFTSYMCSLKTAYTRNRHWERNLINYAGHTVNALIRKKDGTSVALQYRFEILVGAARQRRIHTCINAFRIPQFIVMIHHWYINIVIDNQMALQNRATTIFSSLSRLAQILCCGKSSVWRLSVNALGLTEDGSLNANNNPFRNFYRCPKNLNMCLPWRNMENTVLSQYRLTFLL